MLTVFVDQLYSRPLFELEKIITFIGLEYDRKSLVSIIPNFHENFMKSLHETTIPDEFYQHGLKTLKHELDTTDNMRNWPCKSFIKGIKLQNLLPIKPSEIAANCSSSLFNDLCSNNANNDSPKSSCVILYFGLIFSRAPCSYK